MAKKKKAAGAPRYAMKQERDVYVRMRDGVQIALRIYRPDAPGRYPVLFAASPYQYDTDDLPHSSLFLWHEVGPVEWYVREQGYAYVHAERLLSVSHKLNSAAAVTLATNTYDEVGRLKTKKLARIEQNI